MQGALMKYGAINAKVSVMCRNLLKDKDYDELLSKNSVSEVVSWLKQNSGYAQLLGGIQEGSVHRGQLEGILKSSFDRDCEKLARFSKDNLHRFLKIYVVGAEVAFLKKLLAAVAKNEMFVPDAASSALLDFSFDKQKIVTAGSAAQVLEYLKGTIYYDVLSAVYSGTDSPGAFKTEMALDTLYYKTAWQYAEKYLDKENRAAVKKTLGTETDILNLLWIIRSKRHYNLPEDSIYAYILPVKYRLSAEEIKQLVSAQSEQELSDALQKTKYKNIVKYDDLDLEHFYNDNVLKNMHAAKVNNQFSVMPALGYLHYKQIEIGNIIRIVEGIRYDIDRNELKKYLVWEAGGISVN